MDRGAWRAAAHGVTESGDGLGIIQSHDIYCALYFSYYYTVIYREIVTQLTVCRIRSSGIKILYIIYLL